MSVDAKVGQADAIGGFGKSGLLPSLGLQGLLTAALIAFLLLFYTTVYSVHTDLAGILLSSRLADTLGGAFEDYSLYFPPAERAWFTLAVWLSDGTGLRLDLASIVLTSLAVSFSTGLAYHIRRKTVGASPWFLVVSIAVLVIVPILYKNLYGLREHMVVLGLWPYLVLRLSDPDQKIIGPKTRVIIGIWMGATLTLKYLYALVVLLVELGDAAIRKRPLLLFRIENLIAGAMVAAYLFFWLVVDPAQREAIGVIVSAIDANLASTQANLEQSAIHFSLAIFFLLLAWIYKIPARVSIIGIAMVVAAIVASWIQSRWYSHHLFPITIAYIAWVWMIHREVRLLWIVAICVLFVRPLVGEYVATGPYQRSVTELEAAMAESGISVSGKHVGLLNMHPSPFNQYLAMHGGVRWIASMNNSYVASELKALDRPENEGLSAPAVSLDDPGVAMLHNEMLRLWEDKPPELLILDESTSWPLQFVNVEWKQAFAQDERFQAILAQYRPVYIYKGDMLAFTIYERVDQARASQSSGSPRLRSRAAARPSTSGRCLGARPCPGRIERTLSRVIASPAATSRTT